MIRPIALLLLGLAFAGSAAADEAARPSYWIAGNVDISQAVEGPVYAAGGNVTLAAPVNGRVRLAGGNVKIGPTAAIAGDAAIAGGSVEVAGPIGGALRAAAGQIRIDGPVAGDMSIAAGTLELGPDARIQGRLVFYGRELRRDSGAQVLGGVEQQSGRGYWHERTLAERFTHGWSWTAALMGLAALIAAALPGASQRLAQELSERPWITAPLGLVALISIPIAALLLLITVIGIPFAVLALLLYIALMLVGYVWLAVVVGGMLLDRVKPGTAALAAWRVGAAVLAMLALAIVVRIPVVGGLVHLAAVVLGVGMIVAALFRHPTPADTHAA
ncbi:MAG TPA: hypothetical protein VEG27_01130 [Usitatibacter sp.]|nr:hypothetical protein [Usitatibacter sp.]